MHTIFVLGVIILGTVLASFTDWIFMDALIARFYRAHPQTWRDGEPTLRIIGSQIFGTLATAAAVLLCVWSPGRPLAIAVAAWCAGPLPISLQSLQWMNIHPAIAASHAAGWLTRLLIATLLTTWLLRG